MPRLCARVAVRDLREAMPLDDDMTAALTHKVNMPPWINLIANHRDRSHVTRSISWWLLIYNQGGDGKSAGFPL